jgi:RHS repeat-associated protein
MSVEGGTTTYYAWDRGMTLAEYSPSGADALTWQKSFIYLGGRLLATESGAGTYQYHHPDRLGTRLITNSGGSIISEQVHLPHGTALSGESTNYGSPDNPSKKRFTSYERSDDTKLDHAVNRQYHSGLGRFTQVDPIGMGAVSLSDPQSLNLYAYCGNDPINHTDPDGLFWKEIGNFFKKVGKALQAVAIAVSKVLNNRWVRIGVFALGFLMPGFQLLNATFAKVVAVGLKAYNIASDIASQIQFYAMLVQGKFKELGLSLGYGLIGNAISNLVDPIIEGVQGALFSPQFDELADLFVGGWKGLKSGWSKLGNSFGQRALNLFIGYGKYGGAGHPPDGDSLEVLGADEVFPKKRTDFKGVLKWLAGIDEKFRDHDASYRTGGGRVRADWKLVGSLLWSSARLHAVDIAFSGQRGGRAGSGSAYKFAATVTFAASGSARGIRRLFK